MTNDVNFSGKYTKGILKLVVGDRSSKNKSNSSRSKCRRIGACFKTTSVAAACR